MRQIGPVLAVLCLTGMAGACASASQHESVVAAARTDSCPQMPHRDSARARRGLRLDGPPEWWTVTAIVDGYPVVHNMSRQQFEQSDTLAKLGLKAEDIVAAEIASQWSSRATALTGCAGVAAMVLTTRSGGWRPAGVVPPAQR